VLAKNPDLRPRTLDYQEAISRGLFSPRPGGRFLAKEPLFKLNPVEKEIFLKGNTKGTSFSGLYIDGRYEFSPYPVIQITFDGDLRSVESVNERDTHPAQHQ